MEKQEENTLQSIDSTLKRIEKLLISMQEPKTISLKLPLQASDEEVNEWLDYYSKARSEMVVEPSEKSQKTPKIQVASAIIGTAALVIAAISLLLRL